ncbi:phage tail sheath family protein [Paenibacillus sp. DMB20]|uniref:phage tail sheath family protein n=1 Tax=Paenibacillus sp. DMB20 TaxID=1642570 RepID=UPI0006275CFD|nr:phage tail sheath family protein [Paenibacillus sp. DMB20]KKO50980.1 phage portal protein [Paenibacillus sp. DMB20]
MAGGTWENMNKPVLPGLYMNFKAAADTAIQGGSRGTVVVPVKANWGPVREFVEIGSERAIGEVYSTDSLDGATAYQTLYMALLGGPKKLLAYRLADNTAATASVTLKNSADTPSDVLQLQAKYPGSRGNGFSVTIQPSLGDPSARELRLYEGAKLLGTYKGADGSAAAIAAQMNQDSDNVWVTAKVLGDGGIPADVSGAALSGGKSGNGGITNADYIAMQDAVEGQQFDVLALDYAADMALLQSFAAWVKRLRGEGRGVMAVFGGSSADDVSKDAVKLATARSLALNHEGIINVGTGVRLTGVDYSSAQTAAYVAGLVAGQRLNQSATYAVTPFEDVTRRWTRSEQEQAVRSGVFLFFFDGRQVKALRGINTLVNPAEGQNNAWKKIRSIRVMDAINADLQQAAEQTYIGKVNNTEEGRLALIGAVKEYLAQLSLSNVIEQNGYDVILDPAYYGDSAVNKPEPDQVFLQWNVKLTDVMEQLFGTFYVQ